MAIDLWSSGVMFTALWTGTHLFKVISGAGIHEENLGLIQQIVNVMGWPEKAWPEVAEKPQWREMRKALQLSREPKSFQDRLLSNAVKRPLGKWLDAVDLIGSLVVWNPAMRASAETCLQHNLWICPTTHGPLGAESSPSNSESRNELTLLTPARKAVSEEITCGEAFKRA